jgi:hypothetical protein
MRIVESIVVAAVIAALAGFAVARTHADVRRDCTHEALADRHSTESPADCRVPERAAR